MGSTVRGPAAEPAGALEVCEGCGEFPHHTRPREVTRRRPVGQACGRSPGFLDPTYTCPLSSHPNDNAANTQCDPVISDLSSASLFNTVNVSTRT